MSANCDCPILLPPTLSVPLRGYSLSDGKAGATRDGSFLIYFVEELISLSTSRIAILDFADASHFVEMLPKVVRDRISILDRRHLGGAIELREGLLGPIMHEFDFTCPDRDALYPGMLRGGAKSISESALNAYTNLYFEIGTFLLGMDRKLWIHVCIDKYMEWANIVRASCKSPQSRMSLASLQGLLRTYTTVEAPVLQSLPAAHPQLVETFQRLLEDEAYRELCDSASMLGVPRRVRRALSLMHRAIGRVVLKPAFKHVFDVGAKAVTIATHVPMPGSGIADGVRHTGFLPPIVDLQEAFDRAFQNWATQLPEIIEHPSNDLRGDRAGRRRQLSFSRFRGVILKGTL
jgi:hypothetical protein